MGFTPRAIRHVHPYWQLSSLGVIYIWVLSLGTASWGAHTLGNFQKHPLFSPPSTTSGKIRVKYDTAYYTNTPYGTSLYNNINEINKINKINKIKFFN